VDWSNYNYVKDQGECGSCWAFATTGAIECNVAIKTGTLRSLSEQQLIDCSSAYGTEGCNGAYVDDAFQYVYAKGGLCTETAYDYTGYEGTCQSTTCGTKYGSIYSYYDVSIDSKSSLIAALASGCVTVGIEADSEAYQFYSSGVMSGTCGTNIDHAVLAVGYGIDGSTEYWKVKNSWGTSWGEDGYIRLCKGCSNNGSHGQCGILMEPSYPIVK